MGVLDKNFDTVLGHFLMVDTPSGGGSTVLTAAAAAGSSSLVLTSATGFAIGDDIRVGSGEIVELFRISNLVSLTVTLDKPLDFDHAVGDVVVEQSALDLGTPEADGTKLNLSTELTDTFNEIQRLAFGTIKGYSDLGVSWRYMTLSTDILAVALGLARANVIGDGTAAIQTGTVGPRLLTTDGSNLSTLLNANLVVTGRLNDGTLCRAICQGMSFDPTVMSTVFSRGQLATVPVSALVTSIKLDFNNTAWTPANTVTTYQTSNADQFSEIVSVVELADSGTSSTSTGAISAGAFSFTLASASGFAADDIVAVGTGATREYHYVHSVVTNTLNLRTQVLRAQSSGVTVTKQTKTDVGGIDGGFTFATPGQVTKMRSETSAVSLKNRVGNIAAQMSFNATNLSAETLQRAFGIPSSAYANGILPIKSTTIGKSSTKSFWFKGLTQGLKNLNILCWNGTCQPNGELTLSQAANFTAPIAYKPNGFSIFVNT